jgi:MYXO-CTERM domain-containing protein
VSWSFCWTAPDDARGPLSLHLGVVDGSGGDGTADNPNDPFGDDVFAGTLSLPAVGGAGASSGCAVAQGRPRGPGVVALVVIAAVVLLRCRRERWMLVVVLVALASGCASGGGTLSRVRPWQKEKLAKRIMLVRPDTDESRLDLHMLESREGSNGGFGTSGGGCGCN